MQFDMPVVSASQAGSNSKRRQTGTEEAVDTDVEKLTLKNAQDIRLLRAAVLMTFRFESNSQWIKVFLEATKQYNDAAEALRAESKTQEEIKNRIGIPSTMGFNALILHYISTLENPEQQEKAKTAVKKWNNQWHILHDHIPVAKRESMHQSKFTRLVITCPGAVYKDWTPNPAAEEWTPTDFFIEMRKKWLADGKAIQMRGEAPRGDLERKVQTRVDKKESK